MSFVIAYGGTDMPEGGYVKSAGRLGVSVDWTADVAEARQFRSRDEAAQYLRDRGLVVRATGFYVVPA